MIDTSKLDEPRWYVLHTFTGYEAMAVDNLNKCIVKNNLQDYIMEVKVPMETVIEEDKHGKKKAVERAATAATSSVMRSVSTNIVNTVLGGKKTDAKTIAKRAATNALSSAMRNGSSSIIRGLFGNIK